MPSITAPPTTGPAATASPAIPPQIPMAAPRFSAGKAALISVSVSGITIAAPAPCTARAAISAPTLGEGAAAAEAAVKIEADREHAPPAQAGPQRRAGAQHAGQA